MKKRAIDGLPGLTMQGTKGQTGKRGYTTFYSNNMTPVLYEMGENNSPVFGKKSLGFYSSGDSSSLDSVICFSTKTFLPIVHDRLLIKEEDSLLLYEIADVIEVNLVMYHSTEKEYIVRLTAEQLSSHIADAKSIAYIVKTINNIIQKHVFSNDNVLENNIDEFTSYKFCILSRLDSLSYESGGRKGNTLDSLEITVSSSFISYPEWQGTFNTEYLQVDYEEKHNFLYNIVSVDELDSSSYYIRDDESPDLSELPFIELIDAFTNKTVTANSTVKAFYYNDNSYVFDTSIFDTLDVEGQKLYGMTLISKAAGITDGDVRNFKIRDDEERTAKLLEIKAEGYLPGYFLLADMNTHERGYLKLEEGVDKLKVYLVKNVEEGTKYDIVDYYPYINTKSPCITTYDDEGNEVPAMANYACISFSIFSNMTKEEKEKLAVFVHFSKNDMNKIYNVSRAKGMTTLWDKADGISSESEIDKLTADDVEHYNQHVQNLQETHPFGMISNYPETLNFDNEDFDDFDMIIKYFDEGNDEQTYVAKQVVPRSFITDQNYKIEVYAYYKTTNAVYQKIYFGEADLDITIDDKEVQ